MRLAIKQEADYGCGIACFAFVCNISYQQAAQFLGSKQSNSTRFIVKNFVQELNRYGKSYQARHIKSGSRISYPKGSIVLIRRSKRYPVGHYLAYYRGQWMDPRINLPYEKDIDRAIAGYRKRLPGKPMYILKPTSQ